MDAAAVPPHIEGGRDLPPGDSAERASRALVAYVRAPRRDPAALRAAVCSWVASLRDRGVPAHEVLARAKRLVECVRAAEEPRLAERRGGHASLRSLTERVLHWCVEEYLCLPRRTE